MIPLSSRATAALIASLFAIFISLHTLYSVPKQAVSQPAQPLIPTSDEIRLLRNDVAALRQAIPNEKGASADDIKLLRNDIAKLRETVGRNGAAKENHAPKKTAEIAVTPTTPEGGLVGGWALPKRPEIVLSVQGRENNTSKSRIESFGFFDYSDEEWKLKKQIAKEQDQRQIAKGDNRYMDGRSFYQGNWEPNWSCGYEKRIGKTGDGGKWVCDPFRITNKPADEECVILSVGSENDFSFEAEVHKVNPRCIIHTFDHTITPRNVPPYVIFHKWGLGKTDTKVIRTFPSILKELGLWNKKIDLLKIDCEGCEFAVLDQFFWNEGFFRQVLIELHFNKATQFSRPLSSYPNRGNMPAHYPRQDIVQKNHEIFNQFRDHGYVITHKEPNIQFAGGDCVEFTFLKLNLPKS
eukprot:3932316-Rhodomonas_salina.1